MTGGNSSRVDDNLGGLSENARDGLRARRLHARAALRKPALVLVLERDELADLVSVACLRNLQGTARDYDLRAACSALSIAGLEGGGGFYRKVAGFPRGEPRCLRLDVATLFDCCNLLRRPTRHRNSLAFVLESARYCAKF